MRPRPITFASAAPLVLLWLVAYVTSGQADERTYSPVKRLAFRDPNINYFYEVTSYNVSSPREPQPLSVIRVFKTKLDDATLKPVGKNELVQTLTSFGPGLVDFDLHCLPSHCYLVTVTARPHENVDLYAWQRTQFDHQAQRSSYAIPSAVKLFRIHNGFYIAIAQQQLHLEPYKTELRQYQRGNNFKSKLIGCAVFKFRKGAESALKYHQYIKLPFQPFDVDKFESLSASRNLNGQQLRNHFVVFGEDLNGWPENSAQYASHLYKWSPIDDQFWPSRLTRSIKIIKPKGVYGPKIIQFPGEQLFINVSTPQALPPPPIIDPLAQISQCFSQLDRALAFRELMSRKLIDLSQTLWRAPQGTGMAFIAQTEVTAQVIVHGNVVVRGSFASSPHISVIQPGIVPIQNVTTYARGHSPALINDLLDRASNKLNHIQLKLAQAVSIFGGAVEINSPVRLFAPISANLVNFGHSGIYNSDVRINGLPFRQLEHELLAMRGHQDIANRVVFEGNVYADLLEIHSSINNMYYLRDALDVTTPRLQIIEAPALAFGQPPLAFQHLITNEVWLTPSTPVNDIVLADFITRAIPYEQIIYGNKHISHLTAISSFDVMGPGVLINDYDIAMLAENAIRLRAGGEQILEASQLTFAQAIRVKKLYIQGLINNQINVSTIIHDSVKRIDNQVQRIYGFKRFAAGLRIARLTTDGSINGVPIRNVFNLNHLPPYADYATNTIPAPITGNFAFTAPVTIGGELDARLVNGVDLSKFVVRRAPIAAYNVTGNLVHLPQIVRGHKIFLRPLRVLNGISMLDARADNITLIGPSLVNGYDVRVVHSNMQNMMLNPKEIFIDTLELEGNLNLGSLNGSVPILGGIGYCPIDAFRSRVVLAGDEQQVIDAPISVDSLFAYSASFEANAINDQFNIPEDFVLRMPYVSQFNNDSVNFQTVHGRKSFERIVIGHSDRHPVLPPPMLKQPFTAISPGSPALILGSIASLNNVTHDELLRFVASERHRNSTGETVFEEMRVFGNITARYVNGMRWPDDILLKSASGRRIGAPPSSALRRIYSPVYFVNASELNIVGQLTMRGPVQFDSNILNGVDLNVFARQSVTYGDKDIISLGRPLRNKVFAGGITVDEVRSGGRIDGIDFEEMRRRVVTINASPVKQLIVAPKTFLSDAQFEAPLSLRYINDWPVGDMLGRLQISQDNTVHIFGKKYISGALHINKNLLVKGRINGIDFVDLHARAISLSAAQNELRFNKTLTIEGDVFMDNLYIDERDGVIDGVKLQNLVRIDQLKRPVLNEVIVQRPSITQTGPPLYPMPANIPPGFNAIIPRSINLNGQVRDCSLSCTLTPKQAPAELRVLQRRSPVTLPDHLIEYDSEPTATHGMWAAHSNHTSPATRTTPPYALNQEVDLDPRPVTPAPRAADEAKHGISGRMRSLKNLSDRRPYAIEYETLNGAYGKRQLNAIGPLARHSNPMLNQRLNRLRENFVSIKLIGDARAHTGIVIGFIDAVTNDISALELNDEPTHSGHLPAQHNLTVLDMTDFQYNNAMNFHLSVGVSANPGYSPNITRVYSSIGGQQQYEVTTLPVDSPRTAMFLQAHASRSLFLFISQNGAPQYGYQKCIRQVTAPMDLFAGRCDVGSYSSADNLWAPSIQGISYNANQVADTVHVYLLHLFVNSSSPRQPYFDLFQTLDLPAISAFEHFQYRNNIYALAISQSLGRIHLLMLRGFSGFQIVSYVDAPMIEHVKIVHRHHFEPLIVIYMTNGLHRVLESVII